MRRPPHISPAKWAAASDKEKLFWHNLHENVELVRDVKKMLEVLPRDLLLDNYAVFVCAASGFDKEKALEMAYGVLNGADKAMRG